MKLRLLLFLMSTILISCSPKNKLQNFNVTSYKKVNEEYQYGRESLKFKQHVYTPVLTAKYSNNILVSLSIFKPEGVMSYSAKDLDADTIFMKMLNIPNIRAVEIQNQIIKDNNTKYPISEINKESVFSIIKDSLLVYERR